VHLSVSDATPAARRLYERAGFEVWGSEPDALRYEGESHLEHHMLLRLD
jgi:RimJ/RimL family protein N-acetyltransferase